MAVYVGRWDCTSCGYKGVLGPEKECTNCGADRPKNVKFYMADEADIVQDPAVLKNAKAGADWVCSYCSQNNPATLAQCSDCGNNRSAAQGDKNLQVKEYSTAEVPTTGDGTKEYITSHAQQAKQEGKPKSKKGRKILFAVLGFLLLIVLIFGPSKAIEVAVEGFEWQRTIKVEENRLVEEEDWSVPVGGTQLSSFRDIHHYDKILDHYETRTRTEQRAVGSEQYVCGKRDLGNGYFEDKYCTRTLYESYEEEYEEPVYRKEPVYKTKYRYSIYRWKPVEPRKSSGKDHEAHWPDIQDVEADKMLRTAGRSGQYHILVRDDKNERHKHTIEEALWHKIQKGDQLKAKRGAVTDHYRGLDEDALKEL